MKDDHPASLTDLASIPPASPLMFKFRFFGGLTNEEVGEVMGMSLRTVEREWRKAKAWLRRAISKGELDES
jgi:RNA polymerase sigma factor (sigma-70 family)